VSRRRASPASNSPPSCWVSPGWQTCSGAVRLYLSVVQNAGHMQAD
jgi:hypothetical protein